MRNSKSRISSRKKYIKPEITRIMIDNSITLVMMTTPVNPTPRGESYTPDQQPFASPFGESPFED